jgi:hypothetical protein|tara:strand:- start:726 stop:947 length:222 start_codon:yes stop_codon:yes gene_type:complete
MLSYLSSGVSNASTEPTKLAGLIINLGTFSIVCMVGLLAFLPSWPLAIGVSAGCLAVGYLFYVGLRTPSSRNS